MSLRPFLVIGIPVVALIIAVVLSGLKSTTPLGRQGSKDVYNPAECPDSGFVGSANKLLSELLLDTLEGNHPVTDLESLNRKYQALTFALPYGEEQKAVIEASDLRLVGIKAERIRSDRGRMFYYNSRLPELLLQQKENISDTYFRIYCKGEQYNYEEKKKPVHLTRVEVIPSMFKVALVKDPWTGIIQGAPNCLFTEQNAVFLNYGNSILPLPRLKQADLTNSIKYQAVADEAQVLDRNGQELDYYSVYSDLFKSRTENTKSCANILMKGSKDDAAANAPYFTICCAKEQLYIRPHVKMRIFGRQQSYEIKSKDQGQQDDAIIPLEDGMKIVAYQENDYKIAEFTLFTHDPMRTLSSLSLTNVGRERINLPALQTDLFTRQVVRGLSRNMSNTYNIDTVRLSLDPMLSRAFEKELRNYMYAVKRQIGTPRHIRRNSEQYDISMTVMDMATGDIIATPYYSSRLDEVPEELKMTTRNPAMSRRFIGSTFKPLVALASVLANPNLLSLDTHGKYHLNEGGETATFFGRKTHAWAKKSSSHWGGSRMADFLSYSDDVYPVALASLAMTGVNVDNSVTTFPLSGGNNYFREQGHMLWFKTNKEVDFSPQNHPFNDWITYLYATNYDKDIVTDTIFKNLYTQNNLNHQERRYGLDELIPDVMNMNLDRFLEGQGFRQMLPPWVLGQGDNQWSCIKVAEAWSRMLTKRNVLASLIHNDEVPSSLVDDISKGAGKRTVKGLATTSQTNSTWNGFLSAFRDAQHIQTSHGSTLLRMYNQVQNLNGSGIPHSLVLFSKTGTPDVYDRYDTPLIGGNRRQIDLGMYSFALMDSLQVKNVTNNRPAKGVVCIVRITRTYECDQCSRLHKQCPRCEAFNGVNSTHARNFFSENANRLRKFYDMTNRLY